MTQKQIIINLLKKGSEDLEDINALEDTQKMELDLEHRINLRDTLTYLFEIFNEVVFSSALNILK